MTTYPDQLTFITNEALKHGVPAQQIILTLELTKLELANRLLAHAQAERLADQAPRPRIIVPPDLEKGDPT